MAFDPHSLALPILLPFHSLAIPFSLAISFSCHPISLLPFHALAPFIFGGGEATAAENTSCGGGVIWLRLGLQSQRERAEGDPGW